MRTIALMLYRLSLLLLPRRFRREFGAEMLVVFEDKLREGHTWVGVRELFDVVLCALRLQRPRLAYATFVVVCASLGVSRLGASERVFSATDPAGEFTLTIRDGKPVYATIDRREVARDRIVQDGDTIRLLSADRAVILSLSYHEDKGIEWQPRAAACRGHSETCAQSLPNYARAYFDELHTIGRTDAGRLWGRPIDGPMMFVDPSSRKIMANMADTLGLLHEEDGVWTGHLPDDQTAANTAINWGGRRWTMVLWPVTDNMYARRRLLAHESFHRIAPELGIPGNDLTNSHLGTQYGRVWTRLEWRALSEALLRTGPARTRALNDALIFRAKRRSLFNGASEEERQLELNEGLAEYTGFVLSTLPRSALYDRIAVQLANYEQQDSYSRSFAYASGPAYGVLLDASGKPWRNRINGKSDLSAMAASAYGIGSVDVASAEGRANAYMPARMYAEEKSREDNRVAQEKKYTAAFIDGPTLTIPVATSFSYSFDPNAIFPLQGAGSVMEHSRVTDDWGVLDVASGGVLMRRVNGSITEVVVPVPANAQTPIKGEGWTLQLNPGWSVKPSARANHWIVTK